MCCAKEPTYVWVRELKILRLQGWAIRFCHAIAFQLLFSHPGTQAPLRSGVGCDAAGTVRQADGTTNFKVLIRGSGCVVGWRSAKLGIARRPRAHGIQLPKFWS